ncbi:hypothetical protein [Pseudoalteromonas luteoviolacea]|uniref:Uncharacterized protein n=1 Tax=Pseudoalteromonas luteoviolacea H33 TaxID=1365251 RepID=A0A161Y148_9GAMM|nr:hypothetical protein [Pseudoalteromonas luteoviolacea]KZN49720.1 hypothetical protein N476_18180 [Pseudoalteromonas luteoviolacea H33]KZN77744.1 hypothetical protein N477_00635 [Pseudoalteromonas luteoviolacea H33-S]
MRKLLIAPLITLLTACGGGSDNDSSNSTLTPRADQSQNQPVSENSAPTAFITGETIALSKETITLSTQFVDAESDDLTVNWKSSLADVTFKQNSLSETIVSFPAVTEKKSIVITCEVSDGVNQPVSKNFNITLYPESIGAHIQMADEYKFEGGSNVSINVPFETTSTIKSVTWDIEGFDPDYQDVTEGLADTHGDSSLNLQLPAVTEVIEFFVTIIIETNNGAHKQTAKIKISPADGPVLNVSLAKGYAVSSTAHLSIVPTIANSDDIIGYAWSWAPDPQPTKPSSTKRVYQFYAPNVEQETDFDVSLEVTMKGNITKTATTKVKVSPIPADNKLSLSSSHALAAAGQTVIIKSNLEDTSEVESVTWDIDGGFDKSLLVEAPNQLTIELPEPDDLKKIHHVHYEVKYNTGVTKTAKIPLVYLSTSATRGEIQLKDKYQEFEIYPQKEVTANYKLASSVKLDSVRVVAAFGTYTYDKLESENHDNNLAITLLDNEVPLAGRRFFKVIAKAGLAEKEFNITAWAYDSLLRAYSGIDEVFITGDRISVFGQLIHTDGKSEYAPNWSSDTARFTFENPQTLANEANINEPFRPKADTVKLRLVSQDDNNKATSSELQIRFVDNITIEGEKYNCEVKDRVLQKCVSENDQLLFENQPEQLKQVVARGNYVCLLGYDGKVQCDGETENPVLDVPNLENIVRLNTVGLETVCGQRQDASWQCWGTRATKIENLLEQPGQVHQILNLNEQTCLVRDGKMQCYQDEKKTYESAGKFVSTLLEKDGQICYKPKSSYSISCPINN